MKAIRLVSLLLVVLAVSALPAAAAAPGNTFPGASTYVDNQTHSISPNAPLWYRFDYTGDRSTITLTLVNGTDSGIGFNVFTPNQIGDWWEASPVGRGTAQALNCDSGLPEAGGACQANDLTWVGNFNAIGSYYVEVVNSNNGAADFQLTITGSGVTVAPQSASASMSAVQPAGAGTTVATGQAAIAPSGGPNIDPAHAVLMDSNTHTFPGSTALWYRFSYAGDRSEITITMPNGTNSGLEFNVFTPNQIGDWWDEQPIGRGTSQPVNCSTSVPEQNGGCQSSDLTWVGNFNASGTYYVQVFNNNDYALAGQLMIQGSGVALGQ